MRNNVKRKVLSYVLGFFLVLSMLGIIVFTEAKVGFLSKGNLRTSLVKSNYINRVQETVQSDLQTLFEERGLNPELSDEILTYDAVYMDISNYIDATFAEKEAKISTANFEEELQSKIINQLEAQGVVITDYLSVGINEVVTIAASSYSQYVTPKAIMTLHLFMNKISQNIFILGMVSIVLTMLICTILLCLYRYKHHAMNYIIYSAIATVLLNIVGVVLLAKNQILDGLGIGPQYYLDFINEFMKESIKECYIVTCISVVIVLLLFLVSRLLRNISRK